MSANSCEYCVNNVTDQETGEEYCAVDLDEDEMMLFLTRQQNRCPYFQPGDEYKIVHRQN